MGIFSLGNSNGGYEPIVGGKRDRANALAENTIANDTQSRGFAAENNGLNNALTKAKTGYYDRSAGGTINANGIDPAKIANEKGIAEKSGAYTNPASLTKTGSTFSDGTSPGSTPAPATTPATTSPVNENAFLGNGSSFDSMFGGTQIS